ncbi:MAG: hypothetical protein U9N45_04230 [Gemmatimonadota bacterium]|nr:hypothetical protein [Gemmatimonadota bacterium]
MISDHSITVRIFRSVTSGSLVLALASRTKETCSNITAGSRIITFLKPGDYLAADRSGIAYAFRQSVAWSLLESCTSCLTRLVSSIIKDPAIRESRFSAAPGWLKRARVEAAAVNRKDIMLFSVFFLAVFFAARFLLLKVFPDGDLNSPWSAGPLLCIVLAWLSSMLRTKDVSTERGSSNRGRGLFEKAVSPAVWIFGRGAILIRFFIVSLFRLVNRRPPPVEGGDFNDAE